jgi:hypothetical protein
MRNSLNSFEDLVNNIKKQKEREKSEMVTFYAKLDEIIRSTIPTKFYENIEDQIIKGINTHLDANNNILGIGTFIINITINNEIVPYIEKIIETINKSSDLSQLYSKTNLSIIESLIVSFITDLNAGFGGISLEGDIYIQRTYRNIRNIANNKTIIPASELDTTPNDIIESTVLKGKEDDVFSSIIPWQKYIIDETNKTVAINNTRRRLIETSYRFSLIYSHRMT